MIAFVGGGQMAGALIAGLIRTGQTPEAIHVVEPDAAQRERLLERFAVGAEAAGGPALGEARVLVWAVKPQVLQAAIQPVKPWVTDALHVSIAAGVSMAALHQWLASDRVIRAMPNTPAIVGAGVTGLMAGSGIADADRDLAQALFAPTGHTFWVEDDERLDAVTALTGSGPGYVFQFLASLQAAAQSLGFESNSARELVLKTCAGAIRQASDESSSFTSLRDRVASKGGTTEAGLAVLARNRIDTILTETLCAARHRARELSHALSVPAPSAGAAETLQSLSQPGNAHSHRSLS